MSEDVTLYKRADGQLPSRLLLALNSPCQIFLQPRALSRDLTWHPISISGFGRHGPGVLTLRAVWPRCISVPANMGQADCGPKKSWITRLKIGLNLFMSTRGSYAADLLSMSSGLLVTLCFVLHSDHETCGTVKLENDAPLRGGLRILYLVDISIVSNHAKDIKNLQSTTTLSPRN